MDAASITSFRAVSDDITVVARLISEALFGGLPFSDCTSGRMGAYPAVQLDRDVLGLSVYIVHINSRDRRDYTLELHSDDLGNSPPEAKRRGLIVSNGVLLSEFVANRLQAIPEINVSS